MRGLSAVGSVNRAELERADQESQRNQMQKSFELGMARVDSDNLAHLLGASTSNSQATSGAVADESATTGVGLPALGAAGSSSTAAGGLGASPIFQNGNSFSDQEFARGGLVQGPPSADGKDNIDAKVQADEFVLPPETVAFLGLEFLNRLVEQTTGKPPVEGGMPTEEGKPGFAGGGQVVDQEQEKKPLGLAGMSPVEFSRQQNLERMRQVEAGTAGPTAMQGIKAMARSSAVERPPAVGLAAPGKQSVLPRSVAGTAGMMGIDIPSEEEVSASGKALGASIRKTAESSPADQGRLARQGREKTGIAAAVQGGSPKAIPAASSEVPRSAEGELMPKGVDAVKGLSGVFRGEVAKGDQAQYGKAIYSDSARGATKTGLDADILKSGQGVGTPGQPQRLFAGKQMPNTTAFTDMYNQGTREGRDTMAQDRVTEAMRQYRKQPEVFNRSPSGFSTKAPLPNWMADMMGRNRVGETDTGRFIRRGLEQATDPQTMAQGRQTRGLAAVAKARGRGTADSGAKDASTWFLGMAPEDGQVQALGLGAIPEFINAGLSPQQAASAAVRSVYGLQEEAAQKAGKGATPDQVAKLMQSLYAARLEAMAGG